jgi:RHS repeat-associated protein
VIGTTDEVLSQNGVTYEYDGDGRLKRKTEMLSAGAPRVWEFGWNALGLIARVLTPDGATWRYDYDALGRRIRKTGPDGEVTYLWDGNAILHEVHADAPETPITWTFWPGDFVPVAKQWGQKTYFAITDQIGMPREFVSDDGVVAWSARFTLWGQPSGVGAAAIDMPLRFQGQWFDSETGFHYNGCRYYSPHMAAFVSMDPVSMAGGPNGYAYAPNPLGWIDPHGLKVEPYPVDDQGRPTGASGTLTRRDLRPTDSSPPTIDPPGWQGGDHPYHQQRSHIVADTLGGSGDDARNIVALTDGANHPGMSTVEGQVRRFIQQNGGPVEYTVDVNYQDNHKTPSSVRIRAVDKDGNVIADEKIVNGKRQNTACCK